MKSLLALLFLLTPAVALAADGPTALGPNNGKFGDWTAATYGSGSAKACYAFTTATKSSPSIAKRGSVMLTVTQRKGLHDEVTIGAGYTYPKDAKVTLAIGTTTINFYTHADTAFTSSGSQAITAFKNGDTAEAKSTGPKGHDVTDDFSLTGFSGAYGAITTACP
jgi:invasion protein IalB